MNKNIEELIFFIEKIKSSNILIIVEGKKDKAALQKLGINNIKELSKKPLFQIVEEIAEHNDECIILTDLDREGKLLYSKIKENLTRLGVKIDDRLRERLFRTKLVHMQGLDTYIENLMSS